MLVQIKSRADVVLVEGDFESVRLCVEAFARKAREAGCRANLSGADLSRADLSRADLSWADLSWADLSRADLSWADLSGANLSGADLSRANLSGADLSRANLSWANLSTAKNLPEAALEMVRNDVFAVLLSAPAEAPAVLSALKAGKVDGSTYSGECACLVGTIAKARGCKVTDSRFDVEQRSSRPAERWFTAIKPGDTPETNPASRLAAEWVEYFCARVQPKAIVTKRKRKTVRS